MEVLTLNEIVTDKGLNINFDKLYRFKNQKVEVTIKAIEDKIVGNNILKFAGILSNKDAKLMQKSIDECRNIDLENW
jgi:hypothetical protein